MPHGPSRSNNRHTDAQCRADDSATYLYTLSRSMRPLLMTGSGQSRGDKRIRTSLRLSLHSALLLRFTTVADGGQRNRVSTHSGAPRQNARLGDSGNLNRRRRRGDVSVRGVRKVDGDSGEGASTLGNIYDDRAIQELDMLRVMRNDAGEERREGWFARADSSPGCLCKLYPVTCLSFVFPRAPSLFP